MRERLAVSTCSILASNCIGGIVSHDLGLRFMSPTVNLYFEAEDFVKFLERLDHYLSLELREFDLSQRPYPVGLLDDIRLHFVHYTTPEECVEKWESRKKRVDKDHLYVIMTDRNGGTEELVRRFSRLPYKKVIFSHRPLPYDCVVYVPGFEKAGEVGELNKFGDFRGNRYYEKYFDVVDWLNGGDGKKV